MMVIDPAYPMCRFARKQRGVTLVELMVGMLVGMLAVLVISQVLLTSEGQKRTTTGGADAQVNGALALYTLQRDVEHAGYGITSTPSIIGCPISVRYGAGAPSGFATTLAPVFITPQAARPAGSVGDSIRILASSTSAVAVPTRVIPPNYVAGGAVFNVRSTVGFAQGDLALAAIDDVQPCSVFQVNGAPSATSLPRIDSATWNAAGTPATTYNDGAVMINLGTLVDNRYEINNSTFQVSSFNVADPNNRVVRDIQPDIVQLRAFYGRDTSGGTATDGIVDVFDTTTPTTNAGWQRVLSVRVIAVARSTTYEKDIVTSANPRWSVGASPAVQGAATCPSGSGSCIELDVGAGVAGDVPAKHYRYKVFETVIPLRNMLWRSA
jgi:type IV pilus assembly protein PilW